MKKYTIIALLSFITLLGVAQTKTDTIVSKVQESVLESIPDSSALTFKEVYTDVKSGLSALGSALKIGSEHVYTVLVKQQLTNSIMYLIMVLFLYILTIIGYNKAKKTYEAHLSLNPYDKVKDNYDFSNYDINSSAKGILSVIITILTIILFVSTTATLCTNFNVIITGFINPEYGAIKEVLNIIK